MPPAAAPRTSILSRFGGPIGWTLRAASAVIVVAIVVDRAPLRTVEDWARLPFMIAVATVLPLALVLFVHQPALRGIGGAATTGGRRPRRRGPATWWPATVAIEMHR
ncbi:hypothetical protein [Micromonospora sp. DT233]|uniref:hypothetical protein n=1 Tax=Micromonospora sp. DT233 TaxID=3393432 RepID=UPI003CF837CD